MPKREVGSYLTIMRSTDKNRIDASRKAPDSSRPQARMDFAHRLRELRIARGFRTARSLAKALGIDENRYTRYERAEVEPDLDLIRRMCTVIGVTPNDLLGSDAGDQTHEPPQASTSISDSRRAHSRSADSGAKPADIARAVAVDLAAWKLACAVADAQLRNEPPCACEADSPEASARTPPASMSLLEVASALYRKLRKRPIETIAEFSSNPAITATSTAASARVLAAIDDLLAVLHRAADPALPR
jgi:transcriptional regulator with XRE-family HTH domain